MIMKKLLKQLTIGAVTMLAGSKYVFAGQQMPTDNSDLFVWIFLGFCALIVTLQLVPAITLLWGMLKGIKSTEPVEAKQ
jgi:hypothetical protein